MSSNFAVIPELHIGNITEVAGSALRIELDENIEELTRTHKGRVYPIGQFASIIKVHYGRTILLAYVKLLRMRSEIAREENRLPPSPDDDARVIEASLFGEGEWDSLSNRFQLTRGVQKYPLPGQDVYLTTRSELKRIYGEITSREDADAAIQIGSYVGSDGTPCYANIDKLFGLHCAVLGSTGSGKSATVSAVLHSVLDHTTHKAEDTLRPRVVIIDPHGEYASAFGDRCVVYRAGEKSVEGQANNLSLPYWTMSGEEFRDLVIGKTEYEATSENNIVYKALEHARLVERGMIEEATEWDGQDAEDGFHPENPRPTDGFDMKDIEAYDRDTPDPFSLDEFVKHIELEQSMRIKRGKWREKSQSDLSSYLSVLDKLKVLRNDPRLDFMMKDYEDDDGDLEDILAQFVGEVDQYDGKRDIRIIDISGLPNEVAGPLTAAVSRILFQYKVRQTREERERDPILFVCEEAHRYVPNTGLAQYKSAQTSIRRIAKEGRKYGLGLMLVSQRPTDVERTVLSQCNSWIVLRLSNATDQEHVSRFLPDSLANLARLLPSLSRQEAVFVGEAAPLPARIKVQTLTDDELPHSDDVSFIKGWSTPPVSKSNLQTVVERWRNRDGE
ncbi:ATP-binding protein [Salinibacter sp.]|uniref:ATP-binding protein n=1 Tax=Salinibacter sp. TaxID=2065818 RepID=UPI0021E6F8B9|nr:ATP-binding protein [Salinibacter sp.]